MNISATLAMLLTTPSKIGSLKHKPWLDRHICPLLGCSSAQNGLKPASEGGRGPASRTGQATRKKGLKPASEGWRGPASSPGQATRKKGTCCAIGEEPSTGGNGARSIEEMP